MLSENYSPWNEHLIKEKGQRPEPKTVIARTEAEAICSAGVLKERIDLTDKEKQDAIDTAFIGKKLYFTGEQYKRSAKRQTLLRHCRRSGKQLES